MAWVGVGFRSAAPLGEGGAGPKDFTQDPTAGRENLWGSCLRRDWSIPAVDILRSNQHAATQIDDLSQILTRARDRTDTTLDDRQRLGQQPLCESSEGEATYSNSIPTERPDEKPMTTTTNQPSNSSSRNHEKPRFHSCHRKNNSKHGRADLSRAEPSQSCC